MYVTAILEKEFYSKNSILWFLFDNIYCINYFINGHIILKQNNEMELKIKIEWFFYEFFKKIEDGKKIFIKNTKNERIPLFMNS